ncbi:7alpha-cephem-methoxylase-like protein [Niveomyces insectorum RCEF 264]|uniref:7alpha-cephem-methoxylase-like protein n=1 Tax=Niveomyces insectorum RCEF 264 TaxID=1081102 RepID=A0A167Z6T1_9HYPO|nr:7alpha-cephem-methoxylase-like protein [Niveomyces insectorum RCEF 264]
MAVGVSAPIAQDKVPRGDVQAVINFFQPPADGAKPFNYVDTPPEGEPQRNFSDAPREVTIHDIRGREAEFAKSPESLDHNAFLVVQNQSRSEDVDFADDESIRTKYYPDVEALLLKHVPGSQRVVFFDHTVRGGKEGAPPETSLKRGPVTRAHIDQTAEAAAMRVRKHLPPDEAEKLLQGRYRIINVWRSLNQGPVASFPLAFASSASVADEDVITVEHRYPPAVNYIGQTAAIRHNPAQQWHYWSGMTRDERLLLECFDSEGLKPGSGVQGGRLGHTAFEHPGSPPDAENRRSIEVRTLVFGP